MSLCFIEVLAGPQGDHPFDALVGVLMMAACL